jgi:hypothetical protein
VLLLAYAIDGDAYVLHRMEHVEHYLPVGVWHVRPDRIVIGFLRDRRDGDDAQLIRLARCR